MRTRLGWAIAVLGLLCALLGLAVMVKLGPDSRFTTGPHAIETDGIAVVTAPKVITWADVRIDILAEVPVQKPVFVGVGNTVDVQNLVGKTARLEVTDFATPWKLTTREVKGRANLPGAATALDWWIADSAGLGGTSVSTTLPDESISVAVLAVGSTNLSGLRVSLAYGVEGGFAKGGGLLLLGAGAMMLGLLLRRDTSLWIEEEEIEEVVYVYVDEDGVEHEITAEEAQEYEVVEEEVLAEHELSGQHPTGEHPTGKPGAVADYFGPVTPERPVSSVPGVMTAAEIAATSGVVSEPVTEPEFEPVPESEPADPERVVYVFVDEHGVEHRVGEDELAEFEVVDDEDDS